MATKILLSDTKQAFIRLYHCPCSIIHWHITSFFEHHKVKVIFCSSFCGSLTSRPRADDCRWVLRYISTFPDPLLDCQFQPVIQLHLWNNLMSELRGLQSAATVFENEAVKLIVLYCCIVPQSICQNFLLFTYCFFFVLHLPRPLVLSFVTLYCIYVLVLIFHLM